MGVTGLLGLLKSIQKPCSLKDFRGQTIGVDAYGWLHRGAVSCAVELALGKPTTRYIDFFMHRVRMLIHFGVTPYLVFDGDRLPSKSGTENDRAERRRESKQAGQELLRMGKTAQAYQELQKAVDITPQMARNVIEELKRTNVAYVVAPYEADSQMAYLEKKGIIDAILSEDSDLLVFGAKTLLTKLDQYGECVMIRQSDFTSCRDINLVGWTEAEFRQMAILSGCDYLDGIHKMGLKTAHRFVRKYKTIERVINGIQLEAKMRVPPGYLESFIQAETTFMYQWVFCPEAQELVHLNTPTHDEQLNGLSYIGAHVDPLVARGVAVGDLNPMSKAPLETPSNPASAKRPFFASRTQGTSLASTGKALPRKGIDAFFKPNRVPLAELDPNIFHTTPSQQQLLAQGSRTWTADAPSLQRTSSHPQHPSVPSSRQSFSTSAISASSSHQRPHSQPNKRQRLFSDADESTSPPHKSRFFNTPGPSSSAPTAKRTAKKSGFELWSDDSVEEAMLSLPDVSAAVVVEKTQKSKVSVHKDESRIESSLISLPSDMLLADTAAMRRRSTLDLERFALSTAPSLTQHAAAMSEQVTPMSRPPQNSKSETTQTPAAIDEHIASIVQDSPPLESRSSLSTFMLNSGKPTETAAMAKTPSPQQHPPAAKQALQDSAIAVLDTPTIKRRRTDNSTQAKGSEDMLIPDSDADADFEADAEADDYAHATDLESPLHIHIKSKAATKTPCLARAADSGYGTFVFADDADADDLYDEEDDDDRDETSTRPRLDLGRFVFTA